MRRLAPALLAAALPLSLLAFAPATGDGADAEPETTEADSSAEEPTLITPDPIDFTFHLHGNEAVPFTDDEMYAVAPVQVMDTTPPTGDFQSRQLTNYVGGPNTACSQNGFFPTWEGFVGNGTIVGDATLDIDVVGGLGGPVEVRIWSDSPGGGCNDANVAPTVTTTANLPSGNGKLTVALPMDGIDPMWQLKVMILPTLLSPTSQARFLYDGAEYDATLSFTCQPDDVETQEDADAATCLPF